MLAKYADSTELNKYGARFKYSKFLKVIDDSHEAVTSNITVVKMRRDLRIVPELLQNIKLDLVINSILQTLMDII